MVDKAALKPASIRTVLRRAPRPVWVLVGGVFVNRVGSYFATFVVLFLTERGIAVAELPPLLGAIGIASLVGSLTGGWLADRLGRKRALIVSMTASGVGLTSLAFATEPLHLVLSVGFVALSVQSYVPAASALLVDYTHPDDRVTIFALFRLFFNVGAALGALMAGVIAAVSYTALFLVDGATCLLFALVLLVGLPTVGRGAAASVEEQQPEDGDEVAATSANRRLAPVVILCLALFVVALIYSQHRSTLPLRLTADGLSTEFYGALLAFNGLLVILGEVPLSGYTRRVPWNRPLIAGAVLIGAGMALSGLVPGRAAILAAVTVWTVGEMLLAPVANTAIASLSPPDRIGQYQGFLATAQSLGFSLGPAFGTFAYAIDPVLPWVGSAAAAVVAGAVIQYAKRSGT